MDNLTKIIAKTSEFTSQKFVNQSGHYDRFEAFRDLIGSLRVMGYCTIYNTELTKRTDFFEEKKRIPIVIRKDVNDVPIEQILVTIKNERGNFDQYSLSISSI